MYTVHKQKKNKINKVIATALGISSALTLTGMANTSKCDNPELHVHKYSKFITNEISIDKYMYDEKLRIDGYNWSENVIYIDENELEFYNILNGNSKSNSEKLFFGPDNMDYLNYLMEINNDYFTFFYKKEDKVTDTNKRETITTETGWSKNPYHNYNTGLVALNHHRSYWYRIINNDGTLELEKSPIVDDIKEIIDEYPYFSEDCFEIVNRLIYFLPEQLPDLKPEDFIVFNQPDLNSKELVK